MARPVEPVKPMKKDGFWHFIRRVPSEFAAFDRRKRVARSTRVRITDDPRGVTAQAVVDRMIRDLEEFWAAKREGLDVEPPHYLEEAIAVAKTFGVPYMPAVELFEAGIEAIAQRVALLSSPENAGKEIVFRGLLGGAKLPPKKEDRLKISDMVATVETIRAVDLKKKSPGQLKKWRDAKNLALGKFKTVVKTDKALNQITRNDVINFREQLQERILDEQITAHTGNKYLKQVGGMYNTIRRHYLIDIVNHFEGMLFPDDECQQREAVPVEYVQKTLLQDGLFDDINPEARGVIYLTVETGLRTSEACNLLPENILLKGDIPHIRVLPKNRVLKTKESAREIPLVGCALMAMQANPGGFPRYIDKEASLSALLNKAFAARKLFQSDRQKVYSLRHTFKDRLIHLPEAKDSLTDALMGHADDGQPYGEGYTLAFKHAVLAKIAFTPPSRV